MMKLEILLVLLNIATMTLSQGIEFKVIKSLLPGPTYPIGGLPLFDEHINGHLILRHKIILKFQLRCILMGAQCDIIGKWLKPRVEKIIIENKCENCNPTQTTLVYKWVDNFIERHPDLFRAAVAKYAENLGVKLPPDERKKMVDLLGPDP